MAIDAWVKFGTSDGSTATQQGGQDIGYIVQGAAFSQEAQTFLLSVAAAVYPNAYGGPPYVLQSVRAKEIGPLLWDCLVHYGDADDQKSQEPPETGDGLFDFDTTGETQHITQSLETLMKTNSGAPDFQKAMRVSGEGKHRRVEGVDIHLPGLKFSRTHYLPGDAVTLDYVKTLARCTAKKNESAWSGFDAGELLFLGATGKRRGRGDWEIKFDFAASQNITAEDDITVGTNPDKVVKAGWDFLWIYYRPIQDDDAKEIVPQPYCGYVEKIYEDVDFALLGIGS